MVRWRVVYDPAVTSLTTTMSLADTDQAVPLTLHRGTQFGPLQLKRAGAVTEMDEFNDRKCGRPKARLQTVFLHEPLPAA